MPSVAKKVSVFECPRCKKSSKKEADITKCIAKHEADAIATAEQSAVDNIVQSYANYMVDNVKSLEPNHVMGLLMTAMYNVGYNVIFTRFRYGGYSVGGTEYYSNQARYQASGTITRRPGFDIADEVKKKLNKKTLPKASVPYAYRLFDKKEAHNAGFSTICDFVTGVRSGTGGAGKNDFSYEFNILLNHFPTIKAQIEEVEALKTKKLSYDKRKRELTEEYNKHMLPVLLHADPTYYFMKEESAVLRAEFDAAAVKLSAKQKQMADRQAALVASHSPQYTTPEPELAYDDDRLQKLLGIIPTR